MSMVKDRNKEHYINITTFYSSKDYIKIMEGNKA